MGWRWDWIHCAVGQCGVREGTKVGGLSTSKQEVEHTHTRMGTYARTTQRTKTSVGSNHHRESHGDSGGWVSGRGGIVEKASDRCRWRHDRVRDERVCVTV